MINRFHSRSASGSKDGVALVLVLSFIVLLTILIVSFISFSRLNRMSTVSYSRSIQAQEIAQGGMEDILSDLHQEIVAGSTMEPNPNPNNYPPTYVPVTNWTAQPARFGYDPSAYGVDVTTTNLPPSLIRVSRASQDGTPTHFYPEVSGYYTAGMMTNRASAANSSTPSSNGRYVSAARWNKIDLLSTNSVVPPAFASDTPDWVYVTRGGSRACTTADLTGPTSIKPDGSLTTTNSVVGRYAYAVYDEGSLLDVNVAGYVSAAINSYTSATPTTSYTDPTTGITQVISGKTYSAYADLTQLPGLSSGDGQTIVDNLIKWRDASVNLTGTSGGMNFYEAVFKDALTGFTTFHTGDSPLLGRQDLINYFAQIDPNGTSYSAALPYLGTFTRASNAPSWSPTDDSQNLPGYYGVGYTGVAAVPYKTNAETPLTANRDIPNVIYPSSTPAGTVIIHYADNGTQTTYTVKAGDPVVQHRFSLGKLSWLTYKGPSASLATSDPQYNPGGTAANIKACFGLTWGTNPEGYSCWNYVAGTTSPAAIQTLDQVAAGNGGYREPNFFEMLKAGILSGSLGQTPGPLIGGESAASPGTFSAYVDGVAGSGFATYSADKDRHILQIGANIIDQSDSDSYPTAIYMPLFDPGQFLPEDDLCVNTVYGDENLPSISRVCAFSVETPAKYFKMWFQPEIWNLHQAPATNVTLSNYPINYRLHAYGKLYFTPSNSTALPPFPTPSAVLNYDDSSTSYIYHDLGGAAQNLTGSQAALVYFTDTKGGTAASCFYNNPIRLDKNFPNATTTSLSFPSTTASINLWGELGDIADMPADYTNSSSSATSVTSGNSLAHG